MARQYYGEMSMEYLNIILNSMRLKEKDNPIIAKDIYEEIQRSCLKLGIFQNYVGYYYEAIFCFLRVLHSWVDLVH